MTLLTVKYKYTVGNINRNTTSYEYIIKLIILYIYNIE